jgi:hypothetical protein
MNKRLVIILAAAVCALTATATAQETNNLRTQIGQMEARTGDILIKGYNQVGSIALDQVQVMVRCKETTDVTTGEKAYGLAFEFEAGQNEHRKVLVDDNEVDALLNAVDYLAKINSDVTSLTGFEATYTTKAGLCVIADSVRKEGGILTYLQFWDYPRIAVSSVQMSQLYTLIGQSRKNLDALKTAK